ncbi:22753_t:CDS:2 [Dentiscutata erythropus]|uniref:22753_t:CDS:1 n=1 Tax=Dentiscutata erythropus TaxID=1348616 RepID=A0A9N9N2H8_9GLOM|nr:22753_t:CDS:2 [Dentiscutata erythropus]
MTELLEHVKNTGIKNEIEDEVIILNVGGVKFETTRKTLIDHPETTLGKLFNPKDPESIKPIYPGGNEYFIDRNSHAFYCSLEYYRTGEILWNDDIKSKEFPVSKRAIDLEIEYFKIPISNNRITRNLHEGASIFDKFCDYMILFINEAMSRFAADVSVAYHRDGSNSSCSPFDNYENGGWHREFKNKDMGFVPMKKLLA